MSDSKDNKDGSKSKPKDTESLTNSSISTPNDSNFQTKIKESSKKFAGIQAKSIGFPARKSPSIESTKSIGAAIPSGSSKQQFEELISLTPQGGLPPEFIGEIAYDCCVFVFYCAKHDNIAISKEDKDNARWFPFLAMKNEDSWTGVAIAGSSFILSNGDLTLMENMEEIPFLQPEIIHILRMQLPGAQRCVTRIIYAVPMNNNVTFNCCKNSKRIVWISKESVLKGNVEKLWGPEPFIFSQFAAVQTVNKRYTDEFSIEDVMQFSPRDPPRNKEEELMLSAAASDRDTIALYTEFLNHCFPSQFMSSTSFTIFMIKMGWTPNDNRLFSIFKSFNYRSNGFLTFHELLLGLASMDMATKHGGHPGELRCGYIFRYYDSDNDGLLDYSDIQRMTGDIFVGKQTKTDEKSIERDASFRMEQVLKLKKSDKVQFPLFMAVISNMSFRGTSVLFRSPVSIINRANRAGLSNGDVSKDMPPAIARLQYRGACPACRSKTYRICSFSVAVDFTGRIIEPKAMAESEGTDLNWTTDDPLTEQIRTFSRETVFHQTSPPNTILNILRQFDSIQKKRIKAEFPDAIEWERQDKNHLLKAVQIICKKAEEIFSGEQRCIKLTSPVYVLGDIHGNMADLLVYERNLWRMSPSSTPSNFLFLGDYVDRGEYGVEVACYIFAMKILAPDKFHLCRGNHEIRSIQKCFTFLKECNTKYGIKVGPQIFEACNKVFDRMPICAIIDDIIFGAHGGIPTTLMRIDDLMKIPTPLQEPENESPAAWEMMWNDPMNANDFKDLAEFMKVKPGNVHGFLSNTKRGTAFYYTDEAVDSFLRMNGLQFVLRGHEVVPLGYKFHLNGKVVTVFSSSRYCGGTNEASSIFCDNEELRVIRFETKGTL